MNNYDGFEGAHGTTIFACRDAESFTIRINDANDVQIGVIPGVTNVPNGLMLAEGWVRGYYAGREFGKWNLYEEICGILGVQPMTNG